MSNALIPISERSLFGQDPVLTVDARDLHDFLEVGKDFSTWIKDRIAAYGFVDGRDYATEVFPGFGEKVGRPRIDYFLAIDMAKELAMVERTQKGKEARAYFIECERRLVEQSRRNPLETLLADPRQTLALIKDYSERIVALEDKVANDAPKVEAFEALMSSDGNYTRREAAKALGEPERRFTKWLRDQGYWTTQQDLPAALWIHKGVFAVRVWEAAGRSGMQGVITPQGLHYLRGRLIAHRRSALAEAC
jgi:anti-repressor protein